VIIAILIIVFLALGVSTCLWRRSKKREGYGSLTNDGGSIYYELENGASSANESTPALQPTALEEDPLFSDEEVYAKTTDDDKEVLVWKFVSTLVRKLVLENSCEMVRLAGARSSFMMRKHAVRKSDHFESFVFYLRAFVFPTFTTRSLFAAELCSTVLSARE